MPRPGPHGRGGDVVPEAGAPAADRLVQWTVGGEVQGHQGPQVLAQLVAEGGTVERRAQETEEGRGAAVWGEAPAPTEQEAVGDPPPLGIDLQQAWQLGAQGGEIEPRLGANAVLLHADGAGGVLGSALRQQLGDALGAVGCGPGVGDIDREVGGDGAVVGGDQGAPGGPVRPGLAVPGT